MERRRPSRQVRRRMKRHADETASGVVGCGMYETLRSGAVVKVQDPAALEALREAIVRHVKSGRPLLAQISERAGMGFPSAAYRRSGTTRCWLTMDTDSDNRCAFTTLWVAGDAPPKEEARLVLARLRAARSELQRSGFPARLPMPRLIASTP